MNNKLNNSGFHNYSKNLKKIFFKENNDNKLFTLWINDNSILPELQYISLKSMLLTGHKVTLYVYNEFENVPEGVKILDANKILDESNIFVYKEGFNKGSYSGFADWFRAKCLYENGLSWFDCDILAINNIKDIGLQGPIISSQYNPDGELVPNNAFLRLEKGDPLLNDMIVYMEKVKDNIKHGDTGPTLLKSYMDNKFNQHYKYLSKPDFIASINYFDYMDFLKPSNEMVPSLDIDKIWGFHIWHAMFRDKGYPHEKAENGFYMDLKKSILDSNNIKDYQSKIMEIIN